MEYSLVQIFDKSYQLCDEIQHRNHERTAYEALCAKVFPGLSFEKWYKAGFWDTKFFNPQVLMDGDKIVSAVSVNKMHLQIGNNEPSLYIQLGGVMTDPEYRNQGLSSFLIDKIISDNEDSCQGFYLFANERVLDFYPRFGFKSVDEYQYSMAIDADEYAEKAISLDIENKEDLEKLLEYFNLGNPFSIVNHNNKGLLMFYAMKYNKHDIYYVEEEDAIVVAGHEGEEMVIYDIFCSKGKSLEKILKAVANEETQMVFFGFPLNKTKHCKLVKCQEEDNTLFILDKNDSNSLSEFLQLSTSSSLLLPLLSHS